MRKYACKRHIHLHALSGTYTKLPPLHTALFRAANLLSLYGMIVPKYLLHDLRVLSSTACSGERKSTPCLLQIFLDAVVHHFGIVLGAHAGKKLLFRLRNTESVVGLFNLRREDRPNCAPPPSP